MSILFPKAFAYIVDEPYLFNDEGDELQENLRIPEHGDFGGKGSAWATLYDVRIKYRPCRLFNYSEEIGELFSIRVCSPQFVEMDKRFMGKKRIELEAYDAEAAREKLDEIVESAHGFLRPALVRSLESHFFVSEL